MPWSPVPKFPLIIQALKSKGYFRVNYQLLRKEIILQTGLVKDLTIKNTVIVMEDLGFLKKILIGNTEYWKLIDLSDPIEKIEAERKEFSENKQKEIEQELEKYG